MNENMDLFEAQYEDDFLLRDLGAVVQRADIALTELVANAYDAGASKVDIFIPTDYGKQLTITDDGVGMTKDQFQQRWMKLRYNRTHHQSEYVEFPANRQAIKRKAFGRNGIGRHGLLCFNSEYTVETYNNGDCHVIDVSTKEKGKPLAVTSFSTVKKAGQGTKLKVDVFKHLPSPDYISEVISARFISTPDFHVSVNGKVLHLHEHPGVIDTHEIKDNGLNLKLTLVDSKQNRKDSIYSGTAIWVGGRLVGEPSWRLNGSSILDSRRTFANRYLLVIETDDIRDEIVEDWSGFKSGAEKVQAIAEHARIYIHKKRTAMRSEEIKETKRGVLAANRSDIEDMSALARNEITAFIDEIINENPDINIDTLHLAVKAAINLEKSRYGQSVLSQLASMEASDIGALDQLLEQWSAHDALVALSEIDHRLKVIEALRQFSSDKQAEELQTIHPLVFKARWLFGPEYESPEYSSNNTLQQTIKQVFGKKVDKSAFVNARKRPDIVVLQDSSVHAQAIEGFEDGLSRIKQVLLIEVKRGGFPIGRDEVNQADGYVQDIAYSNLMDTTPHVSAFVVGHEIKPKTAKLKEVKDSEDEKTVLGTVRAVTYSTLIDTAEHRLFKLRSRLSERYEEQDRDELLDEVLGNDQMELIDAKAS
jgi:signal transduction histidine kinase